MPPLDSTTPSVAVEAVAPPYDGHEYEAHDRRWWILGVLVLSLVVVMTANSSLNLAIPSLVRDTNASSTQLQ